MSKRLAYRLDITTHPGISQDESERMLRAFLKTAIRSYRIRCLSVERLEHGQAASEDEPGTTPMAKPDE